MGKELNNIPKCIFCEKTEAEFDNNNCWTIEHIIPEALGNEVLKIHNVCKKCNSGLGTYVDNYFVNHMILKIIRQALGLKGQSGEIPNAFKEGKDKDGHLFRVDENYHPTIVPYIEQNNNTIKIVANTTEEAKDMAAKRISRMNLSDSDAQKIFDKIEHTDSKFAKPEITYDVPIEFNRFFMEALKIAFEYAIYVLGDEYLKDSRAVEIQHYLKSAIDGKMKKECVYFPGVGLAHKVITDDNSHNHFLELYPDGKNNLIVNITLFMQPALSFKVIVSENANNFEKNSSSEIINIKINSSS